MHYFYHAFANSAIHSFAITMQQFFLLFTNNAELSKIKVSLAANCANYIVTLL